MRMTLSDWAGYLSYEVSYEREPTVDSSRYIIAQAMFDTYRNLKGRKAVIKFLRSLSQEARDLIRWAKERGLSRV